MKITINEKRAFYIKFSPPWPLATDVKNYVKCAFFVYCDFHTFSIYFRDEGMEKDLAKKEIKFAFFVYCDFHAFLTTVDLAPTPKMVQKR